MAKLRVVADTNIFEARLDLFVSAAILEELAGVLAAKFRWSRPHVQEAVSEIRDHTQLVQPREALSLAQFLESKPWEVGAKAQD